MTKEDRKNYMKKYRILHKEEIRRNKKSYYMVNVDKLRENTQKVRDEAKTKTGKHSKEYLTVMANFDFPILLRELLDSQDFNWEEYKITQTDVTSKTNK